MKKSRPTAEDDDSCISPFSCLPDDVVLEIFKKIIDLKTLCVCEVVSKRFYEIAHQVDAICYTTPFPSALDSGYRKSYDSAMTSIKKFDRVKSLCIQFPSSIQGSITVNNNNNNSKSVLYKWKVKLGKNKVDSFVFVSPTSIYDKNNGLLLYGEEKDGDPEFTLKRFQGDCFNGFLDVSMLIHMAIDVPSLEKVSITDSDNWGRISVNGREKVDELRKWVRFDFPDRIFACYVPLLELPVSGYVMKKVTLLFVDWVDVINDVSYDSLINDEIDIEHDKEEVAYHEAIKEIFKKHKGSFIRAR